MSHNQVWKWSSPSNYNQEYAHFAIGQSVPTIHYIRRCPYCVRVSSSTHALGGHIKRHRENPVPKVGKWSHAHRNYSAITTIEDVQDALKREYLKQLALSSSQTYSSFAATTSTWNSASPPPVTTQSSQASSSLSMSPTRDTVQINYQPNPTCLKAENGSDELDLTLKL